VIAQKLRTHARARSSIKLQQVRAALMGRAATRMGGLGKMVARVIASRQPYKENQWKLVANLGRLGPGPAQYLAIFGDIAV